MEGSEGEREDAREGRSVQLLLDGLTMVQFFFVYACLSLSDSILYSSKSTVNSQSLPPQRIDA